ncbi:MAG: nucleotide sugar dehydrogenase [Spirochaetota bacterium]
MADHLEYKKGFPSNREEREKNSVNCRENTAEHLKKKLQTKQALIGIIGLGYVGLPLAREFLEAGFRVVGFDVDRSKVSKINSGRSYIRHVGDDFIKKYVDESLFHATGDYSRLAQMDVVIICVPTPIGVHFEPDLEYVVSSTREVAARLRRGQLVVLESTTYPGTTDTELLPILQNTGLQVGKDFFLGYSPEREDPGNKAFTTRNTPKIVSGITSGCLEVVRALYSRVVSSTVAVSSTRVAESAKLLENIYRAVNIALVNELKVILNRMDIDIWEVIEAAGTKPFGFQAFYPGPGLGGHCIPIDPFYLTWKAREHDVHTRFIELAGEINSSMPEYVVECAIRALNSRAKSMNGSRVLVLGVSYKPDVDDTRESPALRLIDLLYWHQARVFYNDPYIPRLPHTRKYTFDLSSTPLIPENLASMDLVVVVTDHSDYDYEMIEEHAGLIVDTRNAFTKNGITTNKIWKA